MPPNALTEHHALQPEGLQAQKASAQKRRRLSYSQTPVTPAKSDMKAEADLEGPYVELYDSTDETAADLQQLLQPEMEAQVTQTSQVKSHYHI